MRNTSQTGRRLRSAVDRQRSTVYVLGELEPRELAMFDAQEIQTSADPSGARIEVLGHGIAYWEAGRRAGQAWRVVVEGRTLIQLTAAAYALLGGDAFEVRIHNWVEARGS